MRQALRAADIVKAPIISSQREMLRANKQLVASLTPTLKAIESLTETNAKLNSQLAEIGRIVQEATPRLDMSKLNGNIIAGDILSTVAGINSWIEHMPKPITNYVIQTPSPMLAHLLDTKTGEDTLDVTEVEQVEEEIETFWLSVSVVAYMLLCLLVVAVKTGNWRLAGQLLDRICEVVGLVVGADWFIQKLKK
jgi:hypothetical protein